MSDSWRFPYIYILCVALDEDRIQRDGMLDTGVIRETMSPWRSSVLLTKKKDPSGTVVGHRFCISLTKVNHVTIIDPWYHSFIVQLKHLVEPNISLDRAFWHIRIAEEDKKKFAVDNQLYEPNAAPNGPRFAWANLETMFSVLGWCADIF